MLILAYFYAQLIDVNQRIAGGIGYDKYEINSVKYVKQALWKPLIILS